MPLLVVEDATEIAGATAAARAGVVAREDPSIVIGAPPPALACLLVTAA